MAVLSDERAAATVPFPHCALHMSGNVALASGGRPRGTTWRAGGRELPLLEIPDERVEATLEEIGIVPPGNLMAEELPDVTELLLGPPAEGNVMKEAVGGDRDRLPGSGAMNLPRGRLRGR